MNTEVLVSLLSEFKDVYKDKQVINPMPDANLKMTVYCDNNDDEFFIENVTTQELGLEIFIVKKWILQSDLNEKI